MGNVYIGCLSLLKDVEDGAKEITYTTTQGGLGIKAWQTNEAAIKYISKTVSAPLSKLILLCTPQVKEWPCADIYNANKKITTYDHVMRVIKECGIEEKNVVCIDIKDNNSDSVPEIINYIDPSDGIYLDMTGGFRDAVYQMITISCFLEYTGANIKKVLYSSVISRSKKGKIEDFSDKLSLIKLINGANEFTSFASAGALDRILANAENAEINNLLKYMSKMADGITLGRVKDLDTIMQNLNNAIEKVSKCETHSDCEKLFVKMLPIIKGKFFAGSSGKIDYLNLISWCLDNRLLQQALTLYTEKIPEYIIDEQKWLEITDDSDIIPASYESKAYAVFYKDFIKKYFKANIGINLRDVSRSGKYKINIEPSDMEQVVGHYYYFKTMRNKINHADSETSWDAKTAQRFGDVYHIGFYDEVEDLIGYMRNSIGLLRRIK